MLTYETLRPHIEHNVRWALKEDIGDGDITAALIPESQKAQANIITREQAIISGTEWVNEVFRQIDKSVDIDWHVKDGDKAEPEQTLFTLNGNTRNLLTGERVALNFLQTLSGTATRCQQLADKVSGTGVRLLDTRKTIPGLRMAQKYAVTCGSCHNHRLGLFDAFLIKENHISACGSIQQAIETARAYAPEKTLEIEVESLEELETALKAGPDVIMLDNFSLNELQEGVKLTAGRAKLEASGGITDQTLRAIAETGVDYISIGALTKDCKAIDLSMRITG